jgi:sugar/nucleoside kinase (ribokinase family)
MPDIIVAGHICLDIIPTIPPGTGVDLIQPGRLVPVEPAVLATGGVSNTGLALHRLGADVGLVHKVGDDRFGQIVLSLLGEKLAAGMIVKPGETTSYSVILSPPGFDRTFLHCPGANHTFRAADMPKLTGRLFHFGYPTIMRSMYEENGAGLARVFERAKVAGMLTSLDLCWPDAAATQQDWRAIFSRVLPRVDLFLPSIEETVFLLDRRSITLADVDRELLRDVSSRLIEFGSKVIVLKLGERGLYLRTAKQTPLGPTWADVERYEACFEVEVIGTTGAGDCTIAGFLAAVLKGLDPRQAMTAATAAGACNVEAADATSGVPTWKTLQARINSGWKKRSTDFADFTD